MLRFAPRENSRTAQDHHDFFLSSTDLAITNTRRVCVPNMLLVVKNLAFKIIGNELHWFEVVFVPHWYKLIFSTQIIMKIRLSI
jgi:hypothetical protein